ncbi:glycoside hydrolase family 108 protein [Pseudorhodoplanes sinuspersici]|uniref:Uncharacterized protein n=1 Tax=Pseudorhodoplanes sinuspersici TaxID=1235591 RepID=A0A1W6ZU93_9HYPH|nr:glycosyl hydrolase 108 family protein [Pseudorhodoplanes sinuspersici]ARQ00964.1 hypothetical protein CAK95_19100 [Pseudorhodoplanes sinuspersici]RKE72599.1 lysozyme family protein [Pseudorhodoplanes sinuspersici]
MVASNYEASLVRVLKHEGGYSNHPSDPGGATNYGITIASYARFKGRAVTAAEVRAMPLSDAKAIYKTSYWNVLRCDELPAGLDYAVFDYGVNSGPSRATKVLQRLLGLAASGAMTDEVIANVRTANLPTLVAKLCDERLAFLKSLKTWPVFGVGWGRRVSDVRRDALAMAKSEAVTPAASSAVSGKGHVPAPTSVRTTTTAATVAAGAGAALATHDVGAPASVVLAVVAMSAVLAVAGWIGWTIWHKRKQDAAAPPVIGANVITSFRLKLKGWRTVIFGGALTVAGASLDILNALQLVDITPLLPPEHALKIIAIIGVATVALRVMTTGRIGQRDC